MDWYANVLGFLTSNNCIGPDGNSMGAFMRCDQGDKPVDHHTLNNMGLPGDMDVVAYGHAGYELTDSVDDLKIGRAHVRTPVTEKSRMPSSA